MARERFRTKPTQWSVIGTHRGDERVVSTHATEAEAQTEADRLERESERLERAEQNMPRNWRDRDDD